MALELYGVTQYRPLLMRLHKVSRVRCSVVPLLTKRRGAWVITPMSRDPVLVSPNYSSQPSSFPFNYSSHTFLHYLNCETTSLYPQRVPKRGCHTIKLDDLRS